MVQIGLDDSGEPDTAVVAQHKSAQRCTWSEVETAGTLPVIYAAEQSHASYFGPDRIPGVFAYDHADGLGGGLWDAEPVRLDEGQGWLNWPGQWGDSETSPRGPAFQEGSKWSDPSEFAEGARDCDS